jgi:hypothetical protein
MIVYLPFALTNIATGLFIPFLGIPFLLPITFVLWMLAGWPYATWLSKKIHADIAYADRDHTLNEGETMPWEESSSSMSEDEMINIIVNQAGRGRDSD